jgi:aspartyl-tRNA(Asn)/glutamyl-tRNA(Gln) amidotransferase subunit A
MGAALQQYDALLCPAAPTPAYRVGEKSSDPLAMYKGGWAFLAAAIIERYGSKMGTTAELHSYRDATCHPPLLPCPPAAPAAAGDLMTVNLNLAGLPAVCLPCGFVEQPGGAKLPVGMQVRCNCGPAGVVVAVRCCLEPCFK